SSTAGRTRSSTSNRWTRWSAEAAAWDSDHAHAITSTVAATPADSAPSWQTRPALAAAPGSALA
ncbi:MAG TPA: hypothetical protein VFF16_10660, partial [Telluria sp.]|nr:hypothetical protein [Telluria sp.]